MNTAIAHARYNAAPSSVGTTLASIGGTAGNMSTRRSVRGVTLIELMVVVVVAAILGSISVSTYRSYLLRTNRTEAKMALLRVQAAQEKFFLQNNRYATNDELDDAPPTGLGVPTSTPSDYYTISLTNVTSVTYTAQAEAKNGQTKDTAACLTLSINQNGTRTPAQNTGCWR